MHSVSAAKHIALKPVHGHVVELRITHLADAPGLADTESAGQYTKVELTRNVSPMLAECVSVIWNHPPAQVCHLLPSSTLDCCEVSSGHGARTRNFGN